MLYYSRQFKRAMEHKHSARMTGIPQLDVPEILVENEEDRTSGGAAAGGYRASAPAPRRRGTGGAYLSADDARGAAASSSSHQRSFSGMSADLSSFDTSFDHPLAGPRASGPGSPGHRNQVSAFSFELHESAGGGGGGGMEDEATSPTVGDGRGSSVSPAQVREMLDDSAWMESIRRSATMKRNTQWGGGS